MGDQVSDWQASDLLLDAGDLLDDVQGPDGVLQQAVDRDTGGQKHTPGEHGDYTSPGQAGNVATDAVVPGAIGAARQGAAGAPPGPFSDPGHPTQAAAPFTTTTKRGRQTMSASGSEPHVEPAKRSTRVRKKPNSIDDPPSQSRAPHHGAATRDASKAAEAAAATARAVAQLQAVLAASPLAQHATHNSGQDRDTDGSNARPSGLSRDNSSAMPGGHPPYMPGDINTQQHTAMGPNVLQGLPTPHIGSAQPGPSTQTGPLGGQPVISENDLKQAYCNSVQALKDYITVSNLLGYDISGKNLPEKVLVDLKMLIHQISKVCLQAIKPETPYVVNVIAKDVVMCNPMDWELDRNHWLNVISSLQLTEPQVATILRERAVHVDKLVGLYQERSLVARQTFDLAQGMHMGGVGPNPGGGDGALGVLLRHGYLPCARNVGQLNKLLSMMRETVGREQKVVMELFLKIVYQVLSPVQAALFIVESFPYHCDMLALANVLYSLTYGGNDGGDTSQMDTVVGIQGAGSIVGGLQGSGWAGGAPMNPSGSLHLSTAMGADPGNLMLPPGAAMVGGPQGAMPGQQALQGMQGARGGPNPRNEGLARLQNFLDAANGVGVAGDTGMQGGSRPGAGPGAGDAMFGGAQAAPGNAGLGAQGTMGGQQGLQGAGSQHIMLPPGTQMGGSVLLTKLQQQQQQSQQQQQQQGGGGRHGNAPSPHSNAPLAGPHSSQTTMSLPIGSLPNSLDSRPCSTDGDLLQTLMSGGMMSHEGLAGSESRPPSSGPGGPDQGASNHLPPRHPGPNGGGEGAQPQAQAGQQGGGQPGGGSAPGNGVNGGHLGGEGAGLPPSPGGAHSQGQARSVPPSQNAGQRPDHSNGRLQQPGQSSGTMLLPAGTNMTLGQQGVSVSDAAAQQYRMHMPPSRAPSGAITGPGSMPGTPNLPPQQGLPYPGAGLGPQGSGQVLLPPGMQAWGQQGPGDGTAGGAGGAPSRHPSFNGSGPPQGGMQGGMHIHIPPGGMQNMRPGMHGTPGMQAGSGGQYARGPSNCGLPQGMQGMGGPGGLQGAPGSGMLSMQQLGPGGMIRSASPQPSADFTGLWMSMGGQPQTSMMAPGVMQQHHTAMAAQKRGTPLGASHLQAHQLQMGAQRPQGMGMPVQGPGGILLPPGFHMQLSHEYGMMGGNPGTPGQDGTTGG